MPDRPPSNRYVTTPGPAAVFVASAYIGRSGVIDFAHQNQRPVHGGVCYRAGDNSARAERRRAEREARRVAKRAAQAGRLAYHREGATLARAMAEAERRGRPAP